MGASTIIAGIGLISNIVGTVKSFKTARNMKDKMEDAEVRAEEALAEAKAGLDLNFFEEMAIQKTPYDIEREAVLSQAAGVLHAGQEAGVRGVAGTAGRVLAAQQSAQADITKRQAGEMMDIDTLVASEDARLRDLKTQISLKESEGAQQAAANYQQLANQATQQGWQGVTSTLQQGMAMMPLFGKDAAGELRAFQAMPGMMPGGGKMEYGPYQPGQFGDVDGDGIPDTVDFNSAQTSYGDFFGDMSLGDYKTWKGGLSKGDYSTLFHSDPFRQSYDMNKTAYDFMNPFLQSINLRHGTKENKGEL